MDFPIILTMIGTGLAIVGTNVALIAWLRADMKSFETKIEGWKAEIQKESKHFHGRLCAIEARYYNENKRRK
jgi:hypothetical protein